MGLNNLAHWYLALMFGLNTARCYGYRPFTGTPTVTRILRDGAFYYAWYVYFLYIAPKHS